MLWGSHLSLVIATLCLIDNATTGHHASSQYVAVKLLIRGKSKDVEGILSVEELLVVIDGVDLGLSLGDIDIVIDVAGDMALCAEPALTDVVSVLK